MKMTEADYTILSQPILQRKERIMLKHVLLTQVMNQIIDLPSTLDNEDDMELILERMYECLEETRATDSEGPLYEALRLMQETFPANPDNITGHLKILIKEFS